MAKGKGIPVNQTKETMIPPAQSEAPKSDDNRIQIIQGNTPVITIQLLAQINKNIIELGKKLDAVIEAAKNS